MESENLSLSLTILLQELILDFFATKLTISFVSIFDTYF